MKILHRKGNNLYLDMQTSKLIYLLNALFLIIRSDRVYASSTVKGLMESTCMSVSSLKTPAFLIRSVPNPCHG